MNTFDPPAKNPDTATAFHEASLTISHIIHSDGAYLPDRIYRNNANDRRIALDKAAKQVHAQFEQYQSLAGRICNYFETVGVKAEPDSMSQAAQIHAEARRLLATTD